MKSKSKKKLIFPPNLDHQSWCFKNDIIIYFELTDWMGGRIVIVEKGEKTVLPEPYRQYKPKKTDAKPHEKVWHLYTEFYNKYNNINHGNTN